MTPTFTFAIPLRSARVSSNWRRVTALLDATMASALASEGADVRIIVACHEIPETSWNRDARVSFITTDRALPTSLAEQMQDKRHKKRMLAEEVCRRGGGYMMLLDSDDLVSRKLAGWVVSDDNRSGYAIRRGYMFNARTGKVDLDEGFDGACGSSSVFWLQASDLERDGDDWPAYVADTRHQDFYNASQQTARPMGLVPFPAVVAVRDNGENYMRRVRSAGVPLPLRWAKVVWNLRHRQQPVPQLLQQEFALAGETYR